MILFIQELAWLTSGVLLQMTENQVRGRAHELEELQESVQQHTALTEEQPELEVELQALQRNFQQLLTPLAERKGKLEAAKAVYQFYRDVADEIVSFNYTRNDSHEV